MRGVFTLVRDVISGRDGAYFEESLGKTNLEKGTTVYAFTGHTYGCISSGLAVTLHEDGSNPFFELPFDAVEPA